MHPLLRAREQRLRYSLFDTAIGECAIVWSSRGVAGLLLPEASREILEARARKTGAEAGPPDKATAKVVTTIQAFCSGKAKDLDAIALDLSAVTEFQRSVYLATRQVARGSTATYGEIAEALGKPGAA